MDVVVVGGSGLSSWRLTGFYGYSRTRERDSSWQLLRELSDLDSLPWIIIGDFNEILNNGEKIDEPLMAERQMRGFRETFGYGDLLDLGFHGAMTTWWNSETQIRLDRAVCTLTWFDLFGHPKLFHLQPSDSDHVPILLKANTIPLASRPKFHRFKFKAFWVQHPECVEVVTKAWRTDILQMLGIRSRLEELLEVSIIEAVQQEKKELMGRLQNLLYQEESFWRQCFKVTWLQEGDRNTGSFHRKAFMTKMGSGRRMMPVSEVDFEAVNKTLEAIQPCFFGAMSDLRPIAMCNAIYKICLKVIANRLKIILPSVILTFQSAFVPGRLITDNILVANEIAHFVHNKREGMDGYMALKLDLNDSMIYAHASLENCYELQDVIETYGKASGQLVNFDKSSVAFSKNVPEEMQDEVSTYLGVQVVDVHEKYLGLPTYIGRKKTATFQYIKEKLAKKLEAWQGKMLTGAGKDILIWVVASAQPT
ncbi:uncharacterized protein LOC133716172 [Rosa rugosa]|uniref:uncharacterized protein LOC133716172 n=1 Tax=Rosa rugosa TaxID=74645 RepID=UPI002B410622|nr:uncharacterized protein LOC133716172 [Rosa rugosa]